MPFHMHERPPRLHRRLRTRLLRECPWTCARTSGRDRGAIAPNYRASEESGYRSEGEPPDSRALPRTLPANGGPPLAGDVHVEEREFRASGTGLRGSRATPARSPAPGESPFGVPLARPVARLKPHDILAPTACRIARRRGGAVSAAASYESDSTPSNGAAHPYEPPSASRRHRHRRGGRVQGRSTGREGT